MSTPPHYNYEGLSPETQHHIAALADEYAERLSSVDDQVSYRALKAEFEEKRRLLIETDTRD